MKLSNRNRALGYKSKKTMVSGTDKHKSQPALRGEDNNRSKPSGDSAQILSLSLFIMLLAFFIVLNAISSFDEQRVNPAIQSIEQTFQTKIEPRGGRQAATETVHDTLMRGSAFDRVKALFRAELPSFRVVQRDGNSLYVLRVRVNYLLRAAMTLNQKLPSERGVSEAQEGVADETRKLARHFLPVLIDILTAGNRDAGQDRSAPAQRYGMTVIFHTQQEITEPETANTRQSYKSVENRLATLAERLEEAGLPKQLLRIGVETGQPDFALLVFEKEHLYDPLSGKALAAPETGGL